MEGLRDRINEVRDHYRLTNRGFADAIGAKPAATNNYLNGTKEPSMEFIDRILTTYETYQQIGYFVAEAVCFTMQTSRRTKNC